MISTFYSYANNSDRLISYNNEKTGFAGFEYDEIGNPTVYKGKLASWENGRQMVAFDGHTFAYDARGRRTKKNDISFTYDSDGNLIRQSDGVQTLVFLYDHTGVFAVKYDNATYYYRKDAQGNVIALLDSTGAIVVKYTYDAWGNCKAWDINNDEITEATHATHIGYLNPFRYRGYYYDVETKLYFLQTRYYDPEIGRFLTIDDVSYLDPDSINGLNLYAYCGNNPVMGVDPNGNAWWNWVISGVTLVAEIALCFVPGAQVAGVSLIVAGATSMASNIMSAAGVDGKTASIISNVLSIIGGVVLCYTPFASIGASMIGSGALGLIGGAITESAGLSYELGSAIGNILGGFLGGAIYKGLVNSGAISFKTSIKNLNNNPADPYTDRFIGPKQNAVKEKIKMIEQTGRYEAITVTRLSKGSYQVENGHHTLRALISLGKRFVWVRFTK